jgi:GH43 family beta-xylosidase
MPNIYRILEQSILLLVLACGFVQAQSFSNPIRNPESADPHVTQKDGIYYYLFTTGDGVWIRKAARLTDVGNATGVKVWSWNTVIKAHVWAPELHYLNGKWYVYASGSVTGNSDPASMRMFVLEANSSDPMGSYTYKGLLSAKYAIDETVWQDPANGNIYMAWSQWDQNIPMATASDYIQTTYITKMLSPTQMGTTQTRISYPSNSWEKQGWWVNEGPMFLKRNNKLHITISVSGCSTPDYALALLSNEDGNYLNSASWKKSTTPVFMRNETNKVWGPGHNAFAKSPNGAEDWIIYHAKSSSNNTNADRSTRMQKFTWDANDYPVFGAPVATGVALAIPAEGRVASSSLWDFNLGTEGWTSANNSTLTASGGNLQVQVTGGDPYIYSPNNLDMNLANYSAIALKVRNQTSDSKGEMFWGTDLAPGFSGTRSVQFSMVPNDNAYRTSLINMTGKSGWSNTLKQLRYDPAAFASSGSLSVDWIKLVGGYPSGAKAVPGTIQLEDYNMGGEGNGYHDLDVVNAGGGFRATEGVDLEATSDVGGGYNVGWINGGEWLEYLVDVSSMGQYDLDLRVAASTADNQVHVEFQGENKTGTILVNSTGGIQVYSTKTVRVTLNAGRQLMRVYVDKSSGGFNLNWVALRKVPVVIKKVYGTYLLTFHSAALSQLHKVYFQVDGNFNGGHSYNDISQTRQILQNIKDAGITFLILDMTNNLQWDAVQGSFLAIDNIQKVAAEKGMTFAILLASIDNPGGSHEARAQIIWEKYAQLPHYQKNPYTNKPIVTLFDVTDPTILRGTYLDKFQLESASQSYWGYRNMKGSPDNTVRFVSPNPGVNGNPVVDWSRVSPTEWETRVKWAKEATVFSIIGSYDDHCDGLFWGIANSKNHWIDPNYPTVNTYYHPDTKDEWQYYNIVKSVLTGLGTSSSSLAVSSSSKPSSSSVAVSSSSRPSSSSVSVSSSSKPSSSSKIVSSSSKPSSSSAVVSSSSANAGLCATAELVTSGGSRTVAAKGSCFKVDARNYKLGALFSVRHGRSGLGV